MNAIAIAAADISSGRKYRIANRFRYRWCPAVNTPSSTQIGVWINQLITITLMLSQIEAHVCDSVSTVVQLSIPAKVGVVRPSQLVKLRITTPDQRDQGESGEEGHRRDEQPQAGRAAILTAPATTLRRWVFEDLFDGAHGAMVAFMASLNCCGVICPRKI